VASFERLTGVRPVYGGKHPSGTHNALVSLGSHLYLEIVAPQPTVEAAQRFSDLARLEALTPVGWAVSAPEMAPLRDPVIAAGFALNDANDGSRLTPAGSTLHWQTFALTHELAGAPFFIVWTADSPHPSTTSPTGCALEHLTVAGPDDEALARLRKALDLP